MLHESRTNCKSNQAVGGGEPCVAASLLSKLDESQDDTVIESVIRNVTGTAYVGWSLISS